LAASKILIVDDEPEFIEVTRVLLESNGYQVVTACDGDEAKRKALDEGPDLVVLDVMMRTVDEGFHVARWLRETESTSDIPIIMLTAVNREIPWARADNIRLPLDGFLDKPVSPEALLKEVQKALG